MEDDNEKTPLTGDSSNNDAHQSRSHHLNIEETALKGNSSQLNPPPNNDAQPLNVQAATDSGSGVPRNPNEQECTRDTWLGCLCILSTIAVIILFIMWLSHLGFTPPPDFQVKSLSFSSFNLSTCEITATWNISFSVINSKKGDKVYYDGIRVFLLYNDEFISATNTASFYQGIGQQSWMNATLGLGGSPVKLNPWIVSAMDVDKSLRKEMFLSVVVDARVSQNPGSTVQERVWMKVFCDYVKVKFLMTETDQVASMEGGGSGSCAVKLEKREKESYN